jgi:hypothetical protein
MFRLRRKTRRIGRRPAAAGVLGVALVAWPLAAWPRGAAEMLARGHTYALPVLTYCTAPAALEALVARRRAGDLDTLPDGCHRPTAAAFARRFMGFVPDHKVTGIAAPEKLMHPVRRGGAPCTDLDTGARVNCAQRIIRSGFIAGYFIAPDATKTQAYIEVGDGIEVADPRTGALQFAPLAVPRPARD